jgi:hypothetical protein
MGPFESLSGDGRADAKTTLFELLQGIIDREDMSDTFSKARQYLVMHTSLHAHDITCIKASENIYIIVPQGTRVSPEDSANMHIKPFYLDVGGYDIYQEI